MSVNYNLVVLAGKLAADPELKYANKETPFIELDVKCKSANKELCVSITVWNHQAALCSQYLVKGSEILVSGELEEYVGEIGDVLCKKLRVKASRVQFLSKKKSAEPEFVKKATTHDESTEDESNEIA